MSVRSENGPLRVGDVFLEKYQILGALGRGGHGCVYRAMNLFMGREVAIKVLSCPDGLTEELRQRGRQEAALLGKLEHPNIVRVYDAGISDTDKLYIVMELLEGQTLADSLRDVGPMDVLPGLRLVEALCEALECAHAAKAVHRDLKPANIFLTKDGTPKILDFGVAKIAGAAGFQTQKNMVVGTILYMSPEQIQGQPATPRSDLYALGLMAFEAFHGAHPLLLDEQEAIPDRRRIAWMQAKKPTPRLDRLLPDFPDYVARLVSVATVKPPGRRFESARQMGATARKFILRYETELSLGYRVAPGQHPRTQQGGAPQERGASLGLEVVRGEAARGESARAQAAVRVKAAPRESARPERKSARLARPERNAARPDRAHRELAGSLFGPPAPGGDTKPLYAMTFPGWDAAHDTSSESESIVSSTVEALAAQSEPAHSRDAWAQSGPNGADSGWEAANSERDWAQPGPHGADSVSERPDSERDWAHSASEGMHSASDVRHPQSDWAHPASTSTSAHVTPVHSGGAGRFTVGLVAALGFGVGLASLALMVPPQGSEATQGTAHGTGAEPSSDGVGLSNEQPPGPAQVTDRAAVPLGLLSPATSPVGAARNVTPRIAKARTLQAPPSKSTTAHTAPPRGAASSPGAQASGGQPPGSQPASAASSGTLPPSQAPASGLPPADGSNEAVPTTSQQKTVRSQNSGDHGPRRPSNPDGLPDSNLWLE